MKAISRQNFLEKTHNQVLILLIICFASFFTHNEVLDASIMEARNFVTAREMVQEGNWLLPTMNGELRLRKPPLPTWLTALSAKIAGKVDDLSVLRFPAAIMASLMIFFCYALIRTFTKDKLLPFVSAAVLATSLYIVYHGRLGMWDIFCHSFMLAGLWAFSCGWKKKTSAYSLFIGAGIAMGCSFMSKGPISFYTVLLPFLVAYLISFGGEKIKKKWREMLVALFVFLCMSLAWPFYVWLTVPNELSIIINEETTAWIERHTRSFWFYWNFPIQIGLWAIFVIAALIYPYAKSRINYFGSYKFFIVWLLITLLLLSIVPEKKDRYLLPAIIPMALLTGYLFRYFIEAYQNQFQDKWDNIFLKTNTYVVALASLAIPVLLYITAFSKEKMSMVVLILYSMIFISLSLLMLFFYKRRFILNLFFSYLMLMVLFTVLIIPYIPSLAYNNPKYHSFRNISAREDIQYMDLYSMGEIRTELIWDAGQKINSWNYRSDLSPLQHLPIAVLSDGSPGNFLPKDISKQLEFIPIDQYDINRSRSTSKDYFKKTLYIIREKN